jgi:hypothetical protein
MVSAPVPPGPVAIKVNEVVAVNGPTVWLPLVGSTPLQPPDAVQELALVVVQVRVTEPPLETTGWLDVRFTVGACTDPVTATEAVAAAVPPGPVAVSVKLVVVSRPVTV